MSGLLRSIALYPRFVADETVRRVRARFDPLAARVPAHITLVFPFSSDLSRDALVAHLSAAADGISAIHFSLGSPFADDEIVQLPLLLGEEPPRVLHRRLYSGILAPFLRRELTYTPHVTLGRCRSAEDRHACLSEAAALVGSTGVAGTLSCEIIELDESSTREIDVPLE